MRFLRSASLVVGASALIAAATFTDPRLTLRLDEKTRVAVEEIISAARQDGLPTEPLVDKALEGATKRASGTVIISAVRRWAGDLKRARQALGPSSSERDIQAAAAAMRAGISVKDIERLAQSRQGVRLASSYETMGSLVLGGVPADTAASVVVALAQVAASDEQLAALQRDIEADVAGGVSATTAATIRGRGLERQLVASAGGAANSGVLAPSLPSGRGQQRAVDPGAGPQAVGSVQGSANVSGAGDGARPAGPRGKPKPKRP